jgi:hypothetical protein
MIVFNSIILAVKDINEIDKVIELAEGGRKIYKIISNSGISAPTKYIRKRFFRKR